MSVYQRILDTACSCWFATTHIAASHTATTHIATTAAKVGLAIVILGISVKSSAQDAAPDATTPAAEAAADAPEPESTSYDVLPIARSLDDRLTEDNRAGRLKRTNALKLQREVQKTVKGALKGELLITDPTTKKMFDGWFEQFVFPQMTLLERIEELPNLRKNFFRDYIRRATSKEAHDYLVNLTHRRMQAIAKGNFHPAARCNAMLLIGMLNSQEPATLGANKRPPDAWLPALKTLLDEFNSPDQIDAVRVAAMVGILRHAELNRQKSVNDQMPLDAKYLVTDAMLALLKAKDPPVQRSAEGHLWMRRRAVDTLAAVGDVGTEGQILAELDRIVGDKNEPISLRCNAVVALGRLAYPAAMKVSAPEKGLAMADIATFMCRAELKRIDDLQQSAQEKLIYSPAQVRRTPTAGGAAEDVIAPIPRYHVFIMRRRIDYQLNCILQGLKGSESQAAGVAKLPMSATDKQWLQGVIERIETLTKLAGDETLDFVNLKKELRAELSRLDFDLSKSPVPRKTVPAASSPATTPAGPSAPTGPSGPAPSPAAGAPALTPSPAPAATPTLPAAAAATPTLPAAATPAPPPAAGAAPTSPAATAPM